MQHSRWGCTRAEWQNHLPRPVGHASFDVNKDTVGLLGCERTLSAQVRLFFYQSPRALLGQAALNHSITQPVLLLGVALTQVQDLVLGLVELHKVHMGPLLKSLKNPQMASLLSKSNVPLHLVSPANLLMAHLIPLSMSMMKILNSIRPSTDPQRMQLISGCHLNIKLWSVTLWTRPSSQFLNLVQPPCRSRVT